MKQQNWKTKIGLVLVIISTLIFALLLIIPLLDFTDKEKIFLTTISIVVAEILFWTGGFLLGRQLFDKYKAYLNPKNWFNGRKKNGT
jgi:Na+/melibiose symporter-like transporter